MQAEDLLRLEVIDSILEEPLGGAHQDPAVVYAEAKKYILQQWDILKTIPVETLLESRYRKFRRMGKFTIEQKKETA